MAQGRFFVATAILVFDFDLFIGGRRAAHRATIALTNQKDIWLFLLLILLPAFSGWITVALEPV